MLWPKLTELLLDCVSNCNVWDWIVQAFKYYEEVAAFMLLGPSMVERPAAWDFQGVFAMRRLRLLDQRIDVAAQLSLRLDRMFEGKAELLLYHYEVHPGNPATKALWDVPQ